MIEYETGFYLEEVPYIKFGKGSKKIVIFPQTGDLTCSLSKDPEEKVKLFSKLLPQNYTIYVLGYDPEMKEGTTGESISDQFAQVVKNKIGPATIIGISYGGQIAILFAAKYPELTSKLILIVSAYALSQDGGVPFCQNVIKTAEEGNHLQITKIMDNLWSVKILRGIMKLLNWFKRKKLKDIWNPLSTLIIAYRDLLEKNGEKKQYLPQIQAPSYILGGTKDPLFSKELYQETADLIPDGHAILFENGGHMVAVEQMKIFKQKFFEVLEL
jgi:pimeloyl-ACP methyl ester carboxylesterase